PKAAPSERSQMLRGLAMDAAVALATEAGVADLALAAAERSGAGFLSRLFTYELGAVHDLTMRLAGCADRAFDRAVASEQDPAGPLQPARPPGGSLPPRPAHAAAPRWRPGQADQDRRHGLGRPRAGSRRRRQRARQRRAAWARDGPRGLIF